MSLNSLGRETPHSNGMTSSRMTHSLSTPSGVDGSTSNSHHSRGGKKLAVRIQMLDDSMTMFQVQVSDTTSLAALVQKSKHKAQFTSGVNDLPRFGSIFVRKESFSPQDSLAECGNWIKWRLLSANWINFNDINVSSRIVGSSAVLSLSCIDSLMMSPSCPIKMMNYARPASFYNCAMLGGYHVAVRHAIESCFFSLGWRGLKIYRWDDITFTFLPKQIWNTKLPRISSGSVANGSIRVIFETSKPSPVWFWLPSQSFSINISCEYMCHTMDTPVAHSDIINIKFPSLPIFATLTFGALTSFPAVGD